MDTSEGEPGLKPLPETTSYDSPAKSQARARPSDDLEAGGKNTIASATTASESHNNHEAALSGPSEKPEAFRKLSIDTAGPTGWGLPRLHEYLREELDSDAAAIPLAAYCFMTGFTDAVSFTACFIWCAFQTGNTIQLSLALARLFSGPGRGPGFQMPDRQALASLVSFIGGAFLGGRLGDHPRYSWGAKSRGWLALATLIQGGFTLAGSLCAQYSHQRGYAGTRADPSWTNGLGFMALAFTSACMGLQSLVGTRLGSPFATTVVLTSVWTSFIADPKLFIRTIYKTRDYKALAILVLFIGGFTGRSLTGSIGPAATLGIGAGLRVGIAIVWMVLPKAKPKEKK